MDLYQKGRKTNHTYSSETLSDYLSGYTNALHDAVNKLSKKSLEEFVTELNKTTEKNGQIFVIGNGGSAAIADHLCCDFAKGTLVKDHPFFRPISLSANVSMYTAAANDFGFENVFSSQLEIYAKTNDLLIAISSSGESANIINGITTAKKMGLKVIGMSGFSGGKVKELSDVSLHVEADNYGLVEDAHQIIMHAATQLIAKRRSLSN